MIFFLAFGLILGALTVIFALQNIVPITVTFLFWQIEGSLALILLLAVLIGVIICAFLSIPEVLKNGSRYREWKKEKDELQKSIDIHKMRNAEMESRVIRAEEAKNTPPAL